MEKKKKTNNPTAAEVKQEETINFEEEYNK